MENICTKVHFDFAGIILGVFKSKGYPVDHDMTALQIDKCMWYYFDGKVVRACEKMRPDSIDGVYGDGKTDNHYKELHPTAIFELEPFEKPIEPLDTSGWPTMVGERIDYPMGEVGLAVDIGHKLNEVIERLNRD